MKSVYKFIRTTLAGGILFLLPVVILISVFRKALEIVDQFTHKWDERLQGEIIWGLDGHNLVGIGLLVLVCFLAGLLFRLSSVRTSVSKLEANLLSYIPGYLLIKSLAVETFSDSQEETLPPVLIKSDDTYRLGFMTDQGSGYCTVFVPDAPQGNAGELHVVPEASVIKLPIKTKAMKHMIRNLGKGVTQYVKP